MTPTLHTTTSGNEDASVLTVLRGEAPILRIAETYVQTTRHLDVLVPRGDTWVVLRSVVGRGGGDFVVGQDADDAVYVAEVRRPTCPDGDIPCEARASTFTLFRLDGATLTQVAQAPAHAAPVSPKSTGARDPLACGGTVWTGNPRRYSPSEADIAALDERTQGSWSAVSHTPARVDVWHMDLSEAEEPDTVAQFEWRPRAPDVESGEAEAADSDSSYDSDEVLRGVRATWSFRRMRGNTWCVAGPIAAGRDYAWGSGGPGGGESYLTYEPLPGVIAGRTGLLVSGWQEATFNGGGEHEGIGLLVGIVADQVVQLGVSGRIGGGSAQGAHSSQNQWAGQTTLLRASVSTATDAGRPDEIQVSRTLEALSLDGATWTPWISAIPAIPASPEGRVATP